MIDDPKRWLDGGTDDADLRTWMQLGSDELAPPDVLARVIVSVPHLPTKGSSAVAVAKKVRLLSALKWSVALLVVAAVAYVLLRSQVRPDGTPIAPKHLPAPEITAPLPPHVVKVDVSNTNADIRPAPPIAQRDEPRRRRAPLPAKLPASVQQPTRPASTATVATSEPPQPTQPEATAQTSTSTAPARDTVNRPNLRATPAHVAAGTEQEELRQLEVAQRTLGEDPTRALVLMRRHAQSYPKSWLAEERDALIVRAYLSLRDPVRANAALALFKTRYPESPQLRQLERACAH